MKNFLFRVIRGCSSSPFVFHVIASEAKQSSKRFSGLLRRNVLYSLEWFIFLGMFFIPFARNDVFNIILKKIIFLLTILCDIHYNKIENNSKGKIK